MVNLNVYACSFNIFKNLNTSYVMVNPKVDRGHVGVILFKYILCYG